MTAMTMVEGLVRTVDDNDEGADGHVNDDDVDDDYAYDAVC